MISVEVAPAPNLIGAGGSHGAALAARPQQQQIARMATLPERIA